MECFGDSSSDEEVITKDDIATSKNNTNSNNNNGRDENNCGICSFHANTEISLLAHVRNNILDDPPHGKEEQSSPPLARSDVLHSIDTFCTSRHWMMHIGPQKGDILLSALRQSIFDKRNRSSDSAGQFIVVELGTYCAYASILMGRLMHQAQTATMKCHVFTTEIHPQYVTVANEMIQLSSMEDMISVHPVEFNGSGTNMVSVVKGAIEKFNSHHTTKKPKIDFLFIDHDKDSYKSDLMKLEASGMIGYRTRVVADNVVFAGIYDYVGYMQQRKREGIVETKTVQCMVEYSSTESTNDKNLEDGIEITDYLRDP